jgi:hypothetical protein
MSDENVPKLRLKPKLAGETPAAAQTPAGSAATPAAESPAAAPVVPAAVPAPAPVPAPAAEAKPSRLRPRIVIEPTAQEGASPVETPAASNPAAAETVAESAPKPKINLKPRTESGAVAPAEAPPASADAPAPVAPNFPPPTAAAAGEPAEAALMRKAAAASFPPPTAKFPPPPGAKKPTAALEKKPAAGTKKNLVPVLGLVAVLVLGGAFFAYKKLTAEPPPAPRPVARKPAVPPPAETTATLQETLDKGKADQLAPLNEVVNADQGGKPAAPAKTPTEASPTAETAAPAPPAVVTPPPPPVASPAFKAWVQNLRIGGMREGANPRVFIEHTAYGPGDVVNPTLGISFVGINSDTRTLIFKDKAGATVELRN